METKYVWSLVIRGLEKEVNDFADALDASIQTQKDDDLFDFGVGITPVAEAMGVESSDDGGMIHEVFPIDLVMVGKGGEKTCELEVDYVSAKYPLSKAWENMVKKYAPHCQLLWVVEENETNFYATNDVNGEHFLYKDYVRRWFDPVHHRYDTKVYFNKEELKRILASVYGDDTLENLIQKVNESPIVDGARTRIYEVKKITD